MRRRLYLECQGRGRPTAILEAGLRNRADIWSEKNDPRQTQEQVLPSVAGFTRVCAYDRPAVRDLHALIRAARIPGPYVLVGHSTGGLLVRLYTSTYPKEIRGMVLVDAIPETMTTSLTTLRVE